MFVIKQERENASLVLPEAKLTLSVGCVRMEANASSGLHSVMSKLIVLTSLTRGKVVLGMSVCSGATGVSGIQS